MFYFAIQQGNGKTFKRVPITNNIRTMKHLLFFLSLAFLLSACAEKQNWELTYNTVSERKTPIITTSTTSTSKVILMDYTEKKVQEHIKATTGYDVEWQGNIRLTIKTTATYKQL